MKKILLTRTFLFSIIIYSVVLISLIFRFKNVQPSTKELHLVDLVDVEQRVTMSGNVQPAQKAIIVAPYSGYIRKIYVHIGDKVHLGTPLVQLSQSLSNFEQSFPLRSPIQGIVVQIPKKEGEFVNQNDLTNFILRIDDMSEVFIKVIAPEIDRFKLKLGQIAHLRPMANNTKEYKAKVVSLSLASGDKDRWDRSNVVEYEVSLKVLNPDQQLFSGLSTLIDIVTAEKKNVLAVPHEYLFKKADKYYVIMANGQQQQVQIGLTNEDLAEITSGLAKGDRIRKIDFTILVDE